MSALFYLPFLPVPSQRGLPAGAAKAFFYLTGTTTLAPIYADAGLTTALPNPVPADALGRLPNIYMDEAVVYRVRLVDRLGASLGSDVDPYYPGQAVTYVPDLPVFAAPTGASAVGFQQTASAPSTTVQTKLRERVTTSGYGSNTAALQAAIDSGAREVIVNNDITLSSDVTLRSNQILRFAGGKIIVPVGATITEAVLKNTGGTRIALVDPNIDASAVMGGVTGVRLFNVTDARIDAGKLKRCNLLLDSSDNTVARAIRVSETVIDMDGYASTAVYISGTRGVAVQGLECFGGAEGIGVYNNARQVALSAVRSHHHTRDGFVVIAGQQIDHTDCRAYSNGQSGFTTQRQTAAENTRFIGYKDCHADLNAYDGFDIRGANDDHAVWDRDICVSAAGCTASSNIGCGFYVVRAQGTKLANCTGRLNGQQNLLIDTADRVNFTNFQSLSGATAIASGNNKAGVTIYNSNMVRGDLVSGNWETTQQAFGISITGTSTGCRITGGDLSNNSSGPYVIPSGNSISGVSGADTAGGAGYFLDAITSQGTFRETGFGVPSHFRPKGSQAVRTDGGGGELYISNGLVGGNPSWSKVTTV